MVGKKQHSKQTQYFECSNEELLKAKYHRIHVKKWRKLIAKITGYGLHCWNFLFKKSGITIDWYPPLEDFTLVKEVKVYNLLTHKYSIRKFNKSKTNYYKKQFYKLLSQIDKNYDKLNKDYIKAHKEFSTFDYWEKYLELNTK